jgi:hypothetical protein
MKGYFGYSVPSGSGVLTSKDSQHRAEELCVCICSDAFVIRVFNDDYARDESTSEVSMAHHMYHIALPYSIGHEYR